MGEYIVKPGDGWYRIAKNTGVNVNDLLKLNNANLNTVIHPGLRLKISFTKDESKNDKSKLVKKSDLKKEVILSTTTGSNYIPWLPTIAEGKSCGVDGCAKYANDALKEHKDKKGRKLYSYKNIGGHAWTRLSSSPNIKMIYSGYEGTTYDPTKFSVQASDARNFAAANRLLKEFDSDTLDKNKTYMVNMFYKGSPSRRQAWEEAKDGITGTHTGNLYWNPETNRWHVSHNIHGTVHDDDFISILGTRGKYGVTAIAEAPYIDYAVTDYRDDYRTRKPIRGWIRDNIIGWKSGGKLIPKAKLGISLIGNPSETNSSVYGLPVSFKPVPKKDNGDWDYNTAAPEGYDLRSIGITRTYEGQDTYGNSDSLPIAHSLLYVNSRLPELADRYNLTIDEARTLLGDTLAIMWNESGGASSKKVNPKTGEVEDNVGYNAKDNNSNYMRTVRFVNNILGRGTSEGYGRVKIEDLRDLPFYSEDTERELNSFTKRSPFFSGLSTFASVAQRFNKLKEMFGKDINILLHDDGSLNELGHALLLTSHNQGFDNIQKNYDNYKLNGNINELEQYKNFRYPRLSLQLIKGHNILGSKPTLLPEATVIGVKKR